MNRTFKEVPSFTAKWHALGLTDDDLRILENILLKNPKTGKVISGTGIMVQLSRQKSEIFIMN